MKLSHLKKVLSYEHPSSMEDDEEPSWYITLDKDPSDDIIRQLEKELDKGAPDWGEYDVSMGDHNVGLHGRYSPSGFKYAKDALAHAKKVLQAAGYKVKQ